MGSAQLLSESSKFAHLSPFLESFTWFGGKGLKPEKAIL